MPSLALLSHNRLKPFFESALTDVRDEFTENPYLEEAQAVLAIGRYRSAIGSLWNAVVDDLREKVIYRSVKLFNEAVKVGKQIKTYEDMQDHVTDDALIDGAYKTGVISWEAQKFLKHAKDTRHIFAGHPRSSPPSVFKVLAMFEDCIKYVLREPYPVQVVDIDEFMAVMATPEFDRSDVAIENAVTQLPEVYTTQLINRLFTVYIQENAGSDLRSNIEQVAPVLWGVLSKDRKIQVVRRVDQEIKNSHRARTRNAISFVRLVKGTTYLSGNARRYITKPLVNRLRDSLDQWETENDCVRRLAPYAANIPAELVAQFVSAITHTFVGHMGYSTMYNRRDFYANGAAVLIPKMFEVFDNTASTAFLDCIRKSDVLRQRVRYEPVKMDRLRMLGKIVLRRVSTDFQEKKVLKALVDSARAKEFWQLLRR